MAKVQKRNIVLLYILGIITLGIYFIYWMYSTEEEMKKMGADIPHIILIFIPIANLYWIYKYCDGFSKYVKKDNNTVIWFIVWIIIGIVMPGIVQSELNKKAR